MLDFERKYWDKEYTHIAGIDEVGRGPLCGPVVASAVIFQKDFIIKGINDSKKLSSKNRLRLYDEIKESALSIGLGIIHEEEIDRINILEATKAAMRIAVDDLKIKPDVLLIDGNITQITNIIQDSIISGDQKSQSIAAASIIAKVTRDTMMVEYNKIYPGYGLDRNMGYGTKEHMEAIKTKLSTPIHRKSFKPVKQYLPKIKDIKDVAILSINLAASDMVKSGHKIIMINNRSLKYIDILSTFNNQYYAFKLHTATDNFDKIKIPMNTEGEILLRDMGEKKDITSSLNISVISVSFSKDKPKIVFRRI